MSEPPPNIYKGLIITYRIKPILGIPLSWTTEITRVEEPFYFVDEQLKGPYSFWRHQHRLRETEEGTEVEDTVHYALPLGPLGRLANELRVKKQLKGIFLYRRQALEELFGKRNL